MSTNTSITPADGDLRVWWIPQIPMKPFRVPVADVEQAKFLLRTLADYDIFQFENNVKPDYCNAGGLDVYESDWWHEWRDDETGRDVDDLLRAESS